MRLRSRSLVLALSVLATIGWSGAAFAGFVSVSYTELTVGTQIDLTAQGTLDWIKFGNGENFSTSFLNTTKIGNPIFLPATLAPLGTPPAEHTVNLIAFTGQSVLNFVWTNGNFGMYNGTGPVDTVVTETILPLVSSYPIGLGATFDAKALAQALVMDVYVQGFNADMVLQATMSGGGTGSVTVSPSQNPPSDPTNDFAAGVFRIVYSGVGETLTISTFTKEPRTDGTQKDFANAGFFAATVAEAVPGAPTLLLSIAGMLALGWLRRSRRAHLS